MDVCYFERDVESSVILQHLMLTETRSLAGKRWRLLLLPFLHLPLRKVQSFMSTNTICFLIASITSFFFNKHAFSFTVWTNVSGQLVDDSEGRWNKVNFNSSKTFSQHFGVTESCIDGAPLCLFSAVKAGQRDIAPYLSIYLSFYLSVCLSIWLAGCWLDS